jgi:Cu(I)/Ag(I) efflux system protein CusF
MTETMTKNQNARLFSLCLALLSPLAATAAADPLKTPRSSATPELGPASIENKAPGDTTGASRETGMMEMTQGEVRKIDKTTQKITLKHGEIKNLGMPPMTMVFQLKDSAALETLSVGDPVRFSAEKDKSGAYVVTSIVRGK